MKKIGIIGGLAWPSTIDYYRLLCTRTNAHFRDRGADAPYPAPPIVLESLDISRMRKLRGREGDEASWAGYDEAIRATFRRLQAAGAAFGMMASNTPHMRLAAIRQGLDFPIVSILESTAGAVKASGGTRALILGTPVTMRSPVYAQTMKAQGIDVLPTPSDDVIGELERLIDVELYQGRVDAARTYQLELCRTLVREPATTPVCLACTELPLAFPEHQNDAVFEVEGYRFVNTTAAHVEAALAEALG